MRLLKFRKISHIRFTLPINTWINLSVIIGIYVYAIMFFNACSILLLILGLWLVERLFVLNNSIGFWDIITLRGCVRFRLVDKNYFVDLNKNYLVSIWVCWRPGCGINGWIVKQRPQLIKVVTLSPRSIVISRKLCILVFMNHWWLRCGISILPFDSLVFDEWITLRLDLKKNYSKQIIILKQSPHNILRFDTHDISFVTPILQLINPQMDFHPDVILKKELVTFFSSWLKRNSWVTIFCMNLRGADPIYAHVSQSSEIFHIYFHVLSSYDSPVVLRKIARVDRMDGWPKEEWDLFISTKVYRVYGWSSGAQW